MFNRGRRGQSLAPRGSHRRNNRGRYEYRPVNSTGSSSTNLVQIRETAREYQQCMQEQRQPRTNLDKYSKLDHDCKRLKREQLQKALLVVQDLRFILQLEVQEASPYSRSDCTLGEYLPILRDQFRRIEQCENILNQIISEEKGRDFSPEEPDDVNYDNDPWSSVGLDEIGFANLDNLLEP